MNINEAVFDRIENAPVAELVVRQIEDMIVQGILKEGDRLPSERDLATRFEVSRPMVRNALKTLEQAKLINIRHGEGTFIAQLTGQAMQPALIDLYARRGRAFQDYLEYRRAQEAFAARLAAERATPTDRAEIERHIATMVEADATGDLKMSREADVRFHSSIVEASHNAMLIHMMASIYELTRRGVMHNRDYLRTLEGSAKKLLQQHRAIAEAVFAQEPDAAEEAARAHLDYVEKSFRQREIQSQNERTSEKRALAGGLSGA